MKSLEETKRAVVAELKHRGELTTYDLCCAIDGTVDWQVTQATRELCTEGKVKTAKVKGLNLYSVKQRKKRRPALRLKVFGTRRPLTPEEEAAVGNEMRLAAFEDGQLPKARSTAAHKSPDMVALAASHGVSEACLRSREARGWDLHEACTTPPAERHGGRA